MSKTIHDIYEEVEKEVYLSSDFNVLYRRFVEWNRQVICFEAKRDIVRSYRFAIRVAKIFRDGIRKNISYAGASQQIKDSIKDIMQYCVGIMEKNQPILENSLSENNSHARKSEEEERMLCNTEIVGYSHGKDALSLTINLDSALSSMFQHTGSLSTPTTSPPSSFPSTTPSSSSAPALPSNSSSIPQLSFRCSHEYVLDQSKKELPSNSSSSSSSFSSPSSPSNSSSIPPLTFRYSDEYVLDHSKKGLSSNSSSFSSPSSPSSFPSYTSSCPSSSSFTSSSPSSSSSSFAPTGPPFVIKPPPSTNSFPNSYKVPLSPASATEYSPPSSGVGYVPSIPMPTSAAGGYCSPSPSPNAHGNAAPNFSLNPPSQPHSYLHPNACAPAAAATTATASTNAGAMHQHAIGSTKDIHTATRVKAPPNTTPIVLPQSVFALFVSYAAENTRRDIEFIGILCGKKIPDVTNPSKLVIACTHLLIPPQHGTKDTCYCDDEELLSDYIIDYNSNLSFEDTSGLIIIGWIHTHPTQKAFLSSVDLHTHMPFQLVFSESIAVVVAVRENDIAIFSMSEDGVQKVKNCQLKGFHPHQENVKVSPIYGIASHVLLVDEAKGVKLCGGQPVPVDLKRWKAAKK